MGFLFELLLEITVEATIELIVTCYLKLMQLILPGKTISDRAYGIVRNVVTVIAIVLLLGLLAGLVMILVPDAPLVNLIGKYIFFISLGISAFQIFLGILVRMIRKFQR
jgi:hypothetical protein